MTSIETHTFSNGLKLVLERLPGCRSAGIAVGFPVGGRTEKPEVSGISHYLEHMIFKGTKTTKFIDRVFEELGANTNGATELDATVYVSGCPRENVFKTLRLWLQLMVEASIDVEEFERERGVILSEYFITEDNLDSLVEKNATSSLFNGHPLASTVIGTEDTIKAITHRDMLDYFRLWYRPSNCVIWVSCDVKMDKLISCVQEHESWMKRGSVPSSNERFKPRGPFAVELRRPTKLVQVGLALSSPTQAAEERASLHILSSMLSSGQSSILRRRLILENELTDHLRTLMSDCSEAGMLLTTFTIQPKKLPQALETLTTTVSEIRENTPRFKEAFGTARDHAIGSFIAGIDAQMPWRALQGAWETLRRGHCSWEETIKLIGNLSFEQFKANVKEVARPERIALVLAGNLEKGASRSVEW